MKIIILFIASVYFSFSAKATYKVYVNVFKPIYVNDTAYFPTVRTCDSLQHIFKDKNIHVKDAYISLREFGSLRPVSISYNKEKQSYYFKTSSESLELLVKRNGFLD